MPLSNSFDNWIFYDGLDVNNTGAVIFQSQDEATQNKLIFNTDSGTTIIKVDNTTNGQGNSSFGRGSIKVLSQYTFTTGNLLLFDALHMPYGVKRIVLNLHIHLLTVQIHSPILVLGMARAVDTRSRMARQRRD